MKISELRRHKWLHYTDLPFADRVCVMVIHGLETVFEPVTDDRGFQIGEEPVHLLHFVGYPKPMKLNNTRLDVLGAMLGEETDNWVGRKVGVMAGPVTYFGKTQMDIVVWAQPVDGYEPTPPVSRRFAAAVAQSKAVPGVGLARGAAPGAGGLRVPVGAGPVTQPVGAAFDGRPIGMANADKFKQALAEQGATYTGFMLWLGRIDPAAAEHAAGREVFDVPRGLVPRMQQYLKEFQTSAGDPSVGGAPPSGQGGPAAGLNPASPGAAGGAPGGAGAAPVYVPAAPAPAPVQPERPPPSGSAITFAPTGEANGYEPITEDDIPF
jgi:hypothetical protein